MAKMKMTVLDMMNVIADKVDALNNAAPGEQREMAVEDANMIANLAKDFFIGANLAVEKERLKAKYKMLESSILDDVIGK